MAKPIAGKAQAEADYAARRKRAVDDAYAQHYDRQFEGAEVTPELPPAPTMQPKAVAAAKSRVPDAVTVTDPEAGTANLAKVVGAEGDEELAEQLRQLADPRARSRAEAVRWALEKTNAPD